MTQRRRKLWGAVALLALIAVYAFLAMLTAAVLQVNASKTVEFAYYVMAGLLWVLPAGWIITWMSRPDPPAR